MGYVNVAKEIVQVLLECVVEHCSLGHHTRQQGQQDCVRLVSMQHLLVPAEIFDDDQGGGLGQQQAASPHDAG